MNKIAPACCCQYHKASVHCTSICASNFYSREVGMTTYNVRLSDLVGNKIPAVWGEGTAYVVVSISKIFLIRFAPAHSQPTAIQIIGGTANQTMSRPEKSS